MGNIFGQSFRIATFGESHGPALGVVIEGCPPRVPFDLKFLKKELARRRPGQSDLTTQRKEEDST
jgi:chorismate synthase